MSWARHFCAAFRFLTIIPLPGKLGSEPEDLAGALGFFPLVGLLLGLLASAAAWLLWQVFTPLVAAVLLTFVLFGFSGALHLDGLADCADGFYSARDRSRTLEIMRDSRIGAMGVLAVVMLSLLKVSLLAALQQDQAVKAALLMPLYGRSAQVLMIFLLPYVRKDGGMGTIFYQNRSGPVLWLSLLILFLTGFLVMGLAGLLSGLTSVTVVFLFSRYCHRKIGGATGDTLGAASEIVETVPLFFFRDIFFL